jgi:hypothetical protein
MTAYRWAAAARAGSLVRRGAGRAGGVAGVLLLGLLPLTACSAAASTTAKPPLTYYLSPVGHDSAAGTSPAHAWRTLARATAARLRPGTRLLLEGGKTFRGQLILTQSDAGSGSRPVSIGSYGRGRATITTAVGSGIAIYDTAGVDIRDLTLSGLPGSARQTGSGINVYSNLQGRRELHHVVIDHVTVSGFANGISVGSVHDTAGFYGLWVDNSLLRGNLDAGLLTYGPSYKPAAPGYAVQDVRISHVTAENNAGNPLITRYSSGNGIVLGSAKDASVTWSTARDNGGRGKSYQGPEGMWTYDSTDVAIEHDLSYANKTRDFIDGNGFGLDENTSNSYLEYDLSYDNEGAGYLIYQPGAKGGSANNTVRYNISSSDSEGRTGEFGGITVFGYERKVSIYQNTVVMRAKPAGYALVLGADIRNITVRNNIFVNQNGPVVAANGPIRTPAALLQGNDYFSAESQAAILWGTTTFPSVQSWRAASGEERLSGRAVGLSRNPEFAGPTVGLPEGAAASLALGSRFELSRGSPVAGKGLNLLRLFGIEAGPVNFAGALVSAKHPDIGAQ